MNNEVILYKDGELELPVEVAPDKETVWLNRNQLAVLFDRDVKTIGKHINNALKEELDSSVVAKFATTASDGKTYKVDYYNLDMIISVGYRVKSPRGIAFRKWETYFEVRNNLSIVLSSFLFRNLFASVLDYK